jgi:hypothetical protein
MTGQTVTLETQDQHAPGERDAAGESEHLEGTVYPRVLIISKTRVNDVDSVGASLRNWFRNCPRENLAQIYSGVLAETGFFCSDEYSLGPSDRRLGALFFKIKRSDIGTSMQPRSADHRTAEANSVREIVRGVVSRFGRWFLRTGLWELLFPVKLSAQMTGWLEAYRPQVLFVQGFDIGFMRLPLAIHRTFGAPICLHIVDDWPEKLYSGTVFSPIVRYFVRKYFHRLLVESQIRLTIGTLMEEEYGKRYGVPFQAMMQCDEPARFAVEGTGVEPKAQSYSIVYSGSVAFGRSRAIVELATAIKGLQINGMNVELHVFAPYMEPELHEAAATLPNLVLKGILHDRDVARTFTRADILFLPESFDKEIRAFTRLSVSTKAHLYMFSRRPILVYGPSEIGVVDYATKHHWACVVDDQNPARLREAVSRILADTEYQNELVRLASSVAAQNHDGHIVREQFRRSLIRLASEAPVH